MRNVTSNWLLLRGLSREQRHWGQFPATFAERLGVEVRCLDAPGFGTEHERSSPRTISAITDDIRGRFKPGGHDWSILAISLGGMVALDWCARYPADFRRCVVINTSSRANPIHQRFDPASLPNQLMQRFRSDEARERAILALSSNNAANVELAGRWAGYLSEHRPSEASVVNQMIAALRFGLPKQVSVPLLVLSSRADRMVSYRSSQAIAERLGARVRLHDTAGHDLPLDDGQWICDQVTDWINVDTSREHY